MGEENLIPAQEGKVVSTFEQFRQLTDGLFRKLLALILLYFIITFLIEIGTSAFYTGKWDILLMIITAFLNIGGMLLAFYYASTQSSQDKDKDKTNMFEKIVEGDEQNV